MSQFYSSLGCFYPSGTTGRVVSSNTGDIVESPWYLDSSDEHQHSLHLLLDGCLMYQVLSVFAGPGSMVYMASLGLTWTKAYLHTSQIPTSIYGIQWDFEVDYEWNKDYQCIHHRRFIFGNKFSSMSACKQRNPEVWTIKPTVKKAYNLYHHHLNLGNHWCLFTHKFL